MALLLACCPAGSAFAEGAEETGSIEVERSGVYPGAPAISVEFRVHGTLPFTIDVCADPPQFEGEGVLSYDGSGSALGCPRITQTGRLDVRLWGKLLTEEPACPLHTVWRERPSGTSHYVCRDPEGNQMAFTVPRLEPVNYVGVERFTTANRDGAQAEVPLHPLGGGLSTYTMRLGSPICSYRELLRNLVSARDMLKAYADEGLLKEAQAENWNMDEYEKAVGKHATKGRGSPTPGGGTDMDTCEIVLPPPESACCPLEYEARLAHELVHKRKCQELNRCLPTEVADPFGAPPCLDPGTYRYWSQMPANQRRDEIEAYCAYMKMLLAWVLERARQCEAGSSDGALQEIETTYGTYCVG